MFGESKIIISPLSRPLLVTDKARGPQSGAGAVHIFILEKLIQTEALLSLGLSLKTDKIVLRLEQTHRGLVFLQVTCYSAAFLAPDLL